MPQSRTIALIGGTGPEGKGLAVRFAIAGHRVLIGSRDSTRAAERASEFAAIANTRPGAIAGHLNRDAADAAGIVFLAVPFAAQQATLDDIAHVLAGKIAVNVIAPIAFSSGRAAPAPPPEGSAAEAAAAQAPRARWVAGFHTLPASDLADPGATLDTDILICSDDEPAKAEILALASQIPGARAVDAGPLQSARTLESATALLINLNRLHRAHTSIRITGLHQ